MNNLKITFVDEDKFDKNSLKIITTIHNYYETRRFDFGKQYGGDLDSSPGLKKHWEYTNLKTLKKYYTRLKTPELFSDFYKNWLDDYEANKKPL